MSCQRGQCVISVAFPRPVHQQEHPVPGRLPVWYSSYPFHASDITRGPPAPPRDVNADEHSAQVTKRSTALTWKGPNP